mgnify:CR=1 FL=1
MIKVVLIDDDALVRAGLRTILSSAGDIDVVGEADDGSRALELVRRARPDVAVVDIRMPILDGIEATRLIRAEPDPPKVLVLTTFDLDEYAFAALKAGASDVDVIMTVMTPGRRPERGSRPPVTEKPDDQHRHATPPENLPCLLRLGKRVLDLRCRASRSCRRAVRERRNGR